MLCIIGKRIVKNILEYGEKSWYKAYFSTILKCDVVDNNIAESFNG